MKAAISSGEQFEKANAGWFDGCNSSKTPWLIPDAQYQWGVNIVNRGGIIQTRPGYRVRLSLPPGNLQGMRIFTATKEKSIVDTCIVFAVSGKIYYAPFPLVQPQNWNDFRLKNLSFDPSAKFVVFTVAEKSVSRASNGTLSVIPTYSLVMMQDGGATNAAYWDGEIDGHLDETAPALQTPRGLWMAFAGERLWMSRGNSVLASDLADPLSFTERTEGATQGDFKYKSTVNGLANALGDNRQSNLVVFTNSDVSKLLSSILDRETWNTTSDFQQLILPEFGCVAGRSIINFQGLLWWYSYAGLVNMESLTSQFLPTKIQYRDVEMARSKANLNPDLSGICASAFENYFLLSVPSGDTFNAHTWIMDTAIANELTNPSSPAWNGIWVGTRPVEWDAGTIDGHRRIFQASVDFQALGGSFNHIWEAFQPDRTDSYEIVDVDNATQLVQNPIYWSWESKLLGDGLDYKRFKYAEVDLCEIGGDVDLKISFGGNKGGYNQISKRHIVSTIDLNASKSTVFKSIADALKVFRVQSRRIKTETVDDESVSCPGVESDFPDNIDKSFSLLIQGCGRCGIEALRIYMENFSEPSVGECIPKETGINILSQDGRSYHLD